MATKVKICGLKTEAGMDAALSGGADYVGLVFFPPSPRNVSPATAQALAAKARGRAKIVALMVDPDDALIETVIASADPDILQLHGDESPERVDEIHRRWGKPIMKAILVEAAFDWGALLGVKDQVPYMLSGGLTPDNVAEAIRSTGASIVDVSSGVEAQPGEKDPVLIDRFLRAAKGAKQGA